MARSDKETRAVWGMPVGYVTDDAQLPLSPAAAHKQHDRSLWLRSAEASRGGGITATFGMPACGGRVRFAQIMEIQRQAGILHAHRQLGVPTDDVFILNDIELRVQWPLTSVPVRTVRGRIRVRSAEASPVRSRVRGAEQRFSVEANGGLRAEGTSRASFVSKAVFRRIRDQRSTASRSMDSRHRGLVRREALVVDRADPILSDHDVDHVSAMSVVCAIERSLRAHGDALLASLSLRFLSYCEADPAPELELRFAAGRRFQGVLAQDAAVYAELDGRLLAAPQRMDG